jgi:hypothetical protein
MVARVKQFGAVQIGDRAFRASRVVASYVERLQLDLVGTREHNEKLVAALRKKDEAMGVLFDRMKAAGIDYSDLIP